jgi:hypothetical protein
MHALMMTTGLALAWGIRWLWMGATTTSPQGWQQTLGLFLFSPLLLLMTAIAVLCMGPTGRMLGHWEGWFSYDLAFGFLIWAIAAGLKLAWEGHQTVRRIRQSPLISVNGNPARLLDTTLPYTAQVGFWWPELVVSQGLLDTLDEEHLTAVLTHERAHAQRHDTFWFFWLGWLRRLTVWLPYTDALWQELLMLRELRADRDAAQQVDPVVLAESLLLVVSQLQLQPEVCAAFDWATSPDRLTERIDSLLSDPPASTPIRRWAMTWLLLALLPLATIPFHVG